MALQSRLFRGDAKLEAAAVSDPAHIVEGSRGPHVEKIQQALIRTDGAAIKADGVYGPRTAAAVSAFKQKRGILNFQGRIDNIVGKKTMAALDSEMLAKEGGGRKGGRPGFKGGVLRIPGLPTTVILPTFKPSRINGASGAAKGGRGGRLLGVNDAGDGPPLLQSLSPLKVEPFNEPENSFILAKSIEVQNGDKNDLDTADPPTRPLTSKEATSIKLVGREIARRSVFLGTSEVTEQERQLRAESVAANGSDGAQMVNIFVRNNDPNLRSVFDVGSSISNRVRGSDAFAKEHDGVVRDIDKALQAQFLTGAINYKLMRGVAPVQGKAGVVAANTNGVKAPPAVAFDTSEPALVALIGSFQACTLILKSFEVDTQLFKYKATLRYELIDHFGVDNSDVVFDGKGHGTPGQVALWLLQHQGTRPGRVPYRAVVIVEKEITGTLLDPALFPDLNLLEELGQFGNSSSFFPK